MFGAIRETLGQDISAGEVCSRRNAGRGSAEWNRTDDQAAEGGGMQVLGGNTELIDMASADDTKHGRAAGRSLWIARQAGDSD